MELRHLRYFVAVADTLHFGRAAAQLHIVQPAVSQQIKRLEREIGVPLFTRTRRQVRLTEPGRLFLQEARRVLAQTDVAVHTAQRAAVGDIGRLSVGFSQIAMWTVFPTMLRAYRDRYPGVELGFNERPIPRLLEGLETGQFDVICVPLPLPGAVFRSKIIAEAPLVVALPKGHSLAARQRVPLTALAHEPFVVFPLSLKTRLIDDLLALHKEAGFAPRIVQEAEPLHSVLSLVSAGIGVILVPAWVEHFPRPGVVYRRVVPAGPRFRLAVVWRADARSPTVGEFIAMVEGMSSLGRT